MPWLTLPESRTDLAPSFLEPVGARAWLAAQPQASALAMVQLLDKEIEAIDGAGLAPAIALELLNLLRSAAVPALVNIESRFFRKALPLPDEEERSFEASRRLWTSLGIAYLRLAPHFPSSDKALPLNRAASALRMAQYCHFLAARQNPPELDRWLFAILAQAESSNVLREPLTDPDFHNLGEANIAGHLAWAFLLRIIDPYRLSATQLIVTNRAISRWRELAAFQVERDSDPKSVSIDLKPLFDAPLPEGIPRWLGVRTVLRKLRQRIDALHNDASPESLKLGRELSASACIRLLKEIESSLRAPQRATSTEVGEVDIAFGNENAYALFADEFLNAAATLDSSSASLAHQRMALFGFDRASQMPNAVKKINVPVEAWNIVDGMAVRPREFNDIRRQAPCLIASRQHGKPYLGILFGLQTRDDGVLTAGLQWYDERVEAGWLKRAPHEQRVPKVPAFLLNDGDDISLILPASTGVRLGVGLALEGTSVEHLIPAEVLERGFDFVRYACRRA